MKQNNTFFIFSIILAFLLFSSLGFSTKISVEKKINHTAFQTGETAHIFLEIKNLFDEPVKVQIEDKNIFANNGLIIECAEYMLPNKTGISIDYNPLTLYNAGEFSLEKAKITYTNPLNKEQEEIFSNDIKITVKGEDIAGNPHELKRIYKCNGISKESTSFSSSSTQQQQQMQQNQQQTQQQKEQEQANQNNKINRMSQNNAQTLSSMKKELQEQEAKENRMREEMKKKIEKSEIFKKQVEKMEQKGFKQIKNNIMPQDENNSNFTYEFKDKNNKSEFLYGNVKNNSVQISKFTEEEMNNVVKNIEKNKKFRKIEDKLKKEGLQRKEKNISPDFTDKKIDFNYTYKNKLNQTKNIIGDATLEGNISSIKLISPEEEEEKRSYSQLWFLLLLAAVLLWFYWRKKKKEEEKSALPKTKKIIIYDWRREVNKYLQKAKKIFYEGRKKDACQELSFGVKLIFKHKNKNSPNLDELKKMTTTEIVASIDDKVLKANVKKCLEKIDMTLFAKHKITRNEFESSLKLSKKLFEERKK